MNTPENTPTLRERHIRVVCAGRDRPDLKAIARATLDIALSSEDRRDGS